MSRRNQKTNLRGGKVRRGNASDCDKIGSLLNFQVRQLFGTVDLEEKMYTYDTIIVIFYYSLYVNVNDVLQFKMLFDVGVGGWG